MHLKDEMPEIRILIYWVFSLQFLILLKEFDIKNLARHIWTNTI